MWASRPDIASRSFPYSKAVAVVRYRKVRWISQGVVDSSHHNGANKMAGFTASWIHGNAVVAEALATEDGGLFEFNHFGWGTQITMRPGFARWFHIAIPAPVILDGKRMKLHRVFLQWQQIRGFAHSASLQDAHLWDGQTRIAKRSNHDFKESGFAVIPGHDTFELHQPRDWQFGVGLSFLLSGLGNVGGHFVDNADAPVIVIGSAGADFDV